MSDLPSILSRIPSEIVSNNTKQLIIKLDAEWYQVVQPSAAQRSLLDTIERLAKAYLQVTEWSACKYYSCTEAKVS